MTRAKAMLLARIPFILGALILACVVAIASVAHAQQPASVDPQASAVHEQQLLKQESKIQGRGTIPDVKSYTIEQPAGREWRHFHQVTLHWIGGIAIIGMLVLLVAFYLIRGMVRLEAGRSGRTLVRFSAFERFVHWMTATCFILLALSGLNITFGKELLLPWLGADAFAAWSQWAKYAHNYLSFPFTIGVVLIFLIWIAWNFPTRVDVEWLKEGGGIVGRAHPPAPDISGMQIVQVIHGVVAVLFVAVMIAHIYIGTIGMQGAFEGMWDGRVDLNFAKEHHSLWLEQEARKGEAANRQRPAAFSAE